MTTLPLGTWQESWPNRGSLLISSIFVVRVVQDKKHTAYSVSPMQLICIYVNVNNDVIDE